MDAPLGVIIHPVVQDYGFEFRSGCMLLCVLYEKPTNRQRFSTLCIAFNHVSYAVTSWINFGE